MIFAFLFMAGCSSMGKEARDVSELPERSAEIRDELKVSEFILGAGDTVEVTVYRQSDMKRTIQINSSGMITYPLIGDIKAAGLGILEFRDMIQEGLSKYYLNPQVAVNVISIRSNKYSVLGEVNRPGIFSLDNAVNIFEATANAGGFTNDAKLETVLLIRPGKDTPELYAVNLREILEEGDLLQNAGVRNGDIIYVPATTIANTSRYFQHLSRIIAPFMSLESAYFTGQQIDGSRGSASVSR